MKLLQILAALYNRAKVYISYAYLRLYFRYRGVQRIHFQSGDKAHLASSLTLVKAKVAFLQAIKNKNYKEAEPLNDSNGLKPSDLN
jgi:hypothetical protein